MAAHCSFRVCKNIASWAVLLAFSSSFAQAQVFTSTPGSAIDSAFPTTSDAIIVSGGPASITSIRIELNITHTWDSDLDIFVTPPGGVPIELSTDNAGSGDNYTATNLTGSADPVFAASGGPIGVLTAAADAPLTGFFTPEGLAGFDALYGTNSNGTWTLEVTDDTGGDTGTLDSWTIEFGTVSADYRITADNNQQSNNFATGTEIVIGEFTASAGLPATLDQLVIGFTGGNGADVTNVRLVEDLGVEGTYEVGTDNILASGANFSTGSLTFDLSPDLQMSPSADIMIIADIATGLAGTLSIGSAADVTASSGPGGTQTFPVTTTMFSVSQAMALGVNSIFIQDFEASTPVNYSLDFLTGASYPQATGTTTTILGTLGTNSADARILLINDTHPDSTVPKPPSGTVQVAMDMPLNSPALATAINLFYDLSALNPATDQVTLGFSWADYGSEDSDGDIVAISRDGGATWEAIVLNFLSPRTPRETYRYATADISAAVTALGGTFGSQFVIRIQEEDNFDLSLDGMTIDDVALVATDGTGTAIAEVREGDRLGSALTSGGAAFDYGSIAVTTSNTQTFTVTNSGREPLTISSAPTLGGTNAADYALAIPTTITFPITLYAGGSFIMDVTFTPPTAGTKVADVQFPHNAAGSPFVLNLTGDGGAATVEIDVSDASGSLANGGNLTDFGSVDIFAGASAAQTVTITNNGNAPMTVQHPVLGGTDAGAFFIDVSNFPIAPTAATVAAGATLTFDVQMNPSTSGPLSASIDIGHDATNTTDPFVVNLTGTGGAPVGTTTFTQVVGGAAGFFDELTPLSDDIVVSGLPTEIHSLAVELTVTHTWDSDVTMTLTAPGSATPITLIDAEGGSFDNFTNMVLTGDNDPERDPAGTVASVVGQAAPFTGLFVVEDAAAWDSVLFPGGVGIDPNGTWTLTLSDAVGGDDGTLEFWTLQFQEGITVTSIVEYDYEDAGGASTAVATMSDPGLTVLDFDAAPGSTIDFFSGNGTTWGISTPGWNVALGSQYWESEFTPTSGNQVTLSELNFDVRRTSTGPTSLSIRVLHNGVDTGYDPGLVVSSPASTYASQTFNFAGTPAAGPFTGTVEVRIVGSGATAAGGNVRVDSWQLDGAVTPQSGLFPMIEVEENSTPISDGGSLALGNVNVSGPTTVNLDIINNGTADLTVDAVTFSNQSNVTASATTGLPLTVSVGGTEVLSLSVTPTGNGSFDVDVEIENSTNGATDPYDISIDGTGIGGTPEIDMQRPAATSISDGGSDAIGNQTALTVSTIDYTIENLGTADLTVTGVTFSNESNVTASLISTVPITVTAGSTATLSIGVEPAANGAFSFDMEIANDDSDEAAYDIAVSGTGTGLAPEIDIASGATPLASGSTSAQGNQLPLSTVTVSYSVNNSGTADLNITGTALQNQSNVSATITSATGAQTLSSQTSNLLTIDYQVQANGAFSFDFVVSSDDSDEGTYTVTVSGTGSSSVPEIDLQRLGSSIADGGSDPVGSQTAGQAANLIYTIENLGTADLTVSNPTINNQSNATATVTANPTSPISAAGTSSFTVQYSASAAGAFSFDVVVSNNDADEGNYTVTVSGTATAAQTQPLLGVSGVTDFNAVSLNSRISALWVVSNAGVGTLDITAVSVSGSSDFVVSGLNLPVSLTAGQSVLLNVSYTASTNQTVSATVDFTSNSGGIVGTLSQTAVTGSVGQGGSSGSGGSSGGSSSCATSSTHSGSPLAALLCLMLLLGMHSLRRRRSA